jgi:hypothetical protein
VITINSIARAAGTLLVVTALSVDDIDTSEGIMMRAQDHALEAKEAAALRALNFATQELANVRLERYHAAYELAEIYAAGEDAAEAKYEALASAVEAAANEHCFVAGHSPLENVTELGLALTNQKKLLEHYEPACTKLIAYYRSLFDGATPESHESAIDALMDRIRMLQTAAGGSL